MTQRNLSPQFELQAIAEQYVQYGPGGMCHPSDVCRRWLERVRVTPAQRFDHPWLEPGYVIRNLPEETRSTLRRLRSDDIANTWLRGDEYLSSQNALIGYPVSSVRVFKIPGTNPNR